jgi:hypothetical protein
MFGHRAMLASAGVGFAIGVVLTLAASPLLSAISSHKHRNAAPISTPVPLSLAQVQARVGQLTDSALSFAYNGKHRVESITLVPDVEIRAPVFQQPRSPLYDAKIQFGLNPNLASTSIQIGGAETDCFMILKALYSHNLPLNDIELLGTFQFPSEKHRVAALRAASDPFVQSKFAWKSLSRSDTKKVWLNLTPHWISRAFRQYVPKP